jgi:toxin FitB
MYLLDTNIVSMLDQRRRDFSRPLFDWLGRSGPMLFLSAMTIAELEAGLWKLRRRRQDERAAEVEALIAGIESQFGERILSMDARVARAIAAIQNEIFPRVLEFSDLIIAATAHVHGLVVLTRNVRHFAPTGVQIIDPLVELPPDMVS